MGAMADNDKNPSSLTPMSKILRELRLLTVDIRRTLIEEELILKNVLQGDGENVWATLRRCNRSRSRCPPLYIYFHVEKDHRERIRKQHHPSSPVAMVYRTSDAIKVLPEDGADDNGYSTQTFHGSQEPDTDENTLSFAEYTEMEPSLKISCIRYLLSRHKHPVPMHDFDCDESSV